MQIIGSAERDELERLNTVRNKCAHPRLYRVGQGEPITLLGHLLDHIATTIFYEWCLPAAFFEQFLIDPDRSLDNQQTQKLMNLLCKNERVPLASKLLTLYFNKMEGAR